MGRFGEQYAIFVAPEVAARFISALGFCFLNVDGLLDNSGVSPEPFEDLVLHQEALDNIVLEAGVIVVERLFEHDFVVKRRDGARRAVSFLHGALVCMIRVAVWYCVEASLSLHIIRAYESRVFVIGSLWLRIDGAAGIAR